MKVIYLSMPIAVLFSSSSLQANESSAENKIYDNPARVSIQQVAPALLGYNQRYIHNGLWQRSELSRRDRSLITLSSLMTRNDTLELPMYTEIALDNGVTPSEISEIITHLAFYAGHSSAYSAATSIQPIFAKRGITAESLPVYDVKRMVVDDPTESKRAENVSQSFEQVSPGVVSYTTDALFNDLWLRPGLKVRDRSMVTVSSLITSGNYSHIPYHLNRAMDNGLTREQASEMLTQLAFYAGWPNVFSAMPYVKNVFDERNASADQ